MTVNSTLIYLECCPKTPEWVPYIQSRAVIVQRHIERLRVFAEHKPGRVAKIVNVEATLLESRLAHVLSL